MQLRLLLPHHDFFLYMMEAENPGAPVAEPVTVLTRRFATRVAFSV
ncbi:MAG: hypothetical protein QXE84_04635 [Candidatus Nitrosotenuis sp.]